MALPAVPFASCIDPSRIRTLAAGGRMAEIAVGRRFRRDVLCAGQVAGQMAPRRLVCHAARSSVPHTRCHIACFP